MSPMQGYIHHDRSTGNLWSEGEFEAAGSVIDAVPRFLIVGIYVREPTDTSSCDCLEICAVGIEQCIIVLETK